VTHLVYESLLATITLNAGDARIRSLTPQENAKRVVFVPGGTMGSTVHLFSRSLNR